METIKERARKYACDYIIPGSDECKRCYDIHGKCEHDAYIQASVWMLGELTRWRDPNDIPDNDTPVIICTSPGIYYIAAYDKQFNYWFTGNGSFYQHEIIGWREIHE